MTDAGSKQKTPRKASPGQFKPGQSGNPAGRPKTSEEVRAYLKEKSLAAAQALVAIFEHPARHSTRDVVSAAKTILEYAVAKPTDQPVDSGNQVIDALRAALTAPKVDADTTESTVN